MNNPSTISWDSYSLLKHIYLELMYSLYVNIFTVVFVWLETKYEKFFICRNRNHDTNRKGNGANVFENNIVKRWDVNCSLMRCERLLRINNKSHATTTKIISHHISNTTTIKTKQYSSPTDKKTDRQSLWQPSDYIRVVTTHNIRSHLIQIIRKSEQKLLI